MTEDEAKRWIVETFGDAIYKRLQLLESLVIDESARQNLIARSTLANIWSRHIADSAQLLRHAPPQSGRWVDVGTGAGFPGLVIATLRSASTILVEPRQKRAAFLDTAVEALGLGDHTTVICDSISSCGTTASVISARAVTSLSRLFDLASSCATPQTTWIVPKGRIAIEEVERARETWHGVFHVEQSITDPASLVVIASGVLPR